MNKLFILFFLLLATACQQKKEVKKWPAQADWNELSKSVEGRLIQVETPKDELLTTLKNPFVIEEYPWGTQSTGWLNAWSAAVSPYAVAAQDANDIVAAVKFAKKHGVKLVVKGTGHDYLGRSNAPNSLLVWTHPMREVMIHEAFIPAGAPLKAKGVPAVTAFAGARWVEVYNEVTTKHNRYVQGGGCATVGAAGGFIQGGGFGSFSKKYGLAAGSLLEAEIVLASGEVLLANAYQNADLFWALKGGGGSTFGIVTKVTLETHELPAYFGSFQGKIAAKTDEAFQDLLDYFISFYQENLSNEHWGEQVAIKPDNSLELGLVFQGLDKQEVEELWKPFLSWIDERSDLSITTQLILVPANKFWDKEYLEQNLPNVITPYGNMFYWASNQNEVLAYWFAMQSRWIPKSHFENSKAFAETLFKASRYWELVLHFNKGLADASPEASQRTRNTSINPKVLQAPALLILDAVQLDVFPGVKGREPSIQMGLEQAKKLQAATKEIAAAVPDTSTYSNEGDYFQENWKEDFWGEHYPRLLEIKRKYDPEGFFKCHHSVGSDS